MHRVSVSCLWFFGVLLLPCPALEPIAADSVWNFMDFSEVPQRMPPSFWRDLSSRFRRSLRRQVLTSSPEGSFGTSSASPAVPQPAAANFALVPKYLMAFPMPSVPPQGVGPTYLGYKRGWLLTRKSSTSEVFDHKRWVSYLSIINTFATYRLIRDKPVQVVSDSEGVWLPMPKRLFKGKGRDIVCFSPRTIQGAGNVASAWSKHWETEFPAVNGLLVSIFDEKHRPTYYRLEVESNTPACIKELSNPIYANVRFILDPAKVNSVSLVDNQLNYRKFSIRGFLTTAFQTEHDEPSTTEPIVESPPQQVSEMAYYFLVRSRTRLTRPRKDYENKDEMSSSERLPDWIREGPLVVSSLKAYNADIVETQFSNPTALVKAFFPKTIWEINPTSEFQEKTYNEVPDVTIFALKVESIVKNTIDPFNAATFHVRLNIHQKVDFGAQLMFQCSGRKDVDSWERSTTLAENDVAAFLVRCPEDVANSHIVNAKVYVAVRSDELRALNNEHLEIAVLKSLTPKELKYLLEGEQFHLGEAQQNMNALAERYTQNPIRFVESEVGFVVASHEKDYEALRLKFRDEGVSPADVALAISRATADGDEENKKKLEEEFQNKINNRYVENCLPYMIKTDKADIINVLAYYVNGKNIFEPAIEAAIYDQQQDIARQMQNTSLIWNTNKEALPLGWHQNLYRFKTRRVYIHSMLKETNLVNGCKSQEYGEDILNIKQTLAKLIYPSNMQLAKLSAFLHELSTHNA